MKRYGFTAVCTAVLLICGCSSLKYGTLDGLVYTSGDRKVKISFPEGKAPEITAGYLESKYTCPDDFEVVYLDSVTGSFLVCSAVIPPERIKSAEVKKLLRTSDGEASVFAATARIVQQKHRSTLNLLESLLEKAPTRSIVPTATKITLILGMANRQIGKRRKKIILYYGQ